MVLKFALILGLEMDMKQLALKLAPYAFASPSYAQTPNKMHSQDKNSKLNNITIELLHCLLTTLHILSYLDDRDILCISL